MMRIGIDVGGTNTDAVVMKGDEVIAATKQATTEDVIGGVEAAMTAVMAEAGVATSDIDAVMIGTTHFTNALAQARDLIPVAAVRIAPEPQELPPMVEWPTRVREAMGGVPYTCGGGHEFDGRPIQPLDEDAVRRIAGDIRARGLTAVSVSAVFSPVNPACELRAAEILTAELGPGVTIGMSHELGTVGLLERENATIMNACLRGLAPRVVEAFTGAVARCGITAAIYLSQNDGTLMSAEHALRYPVAAVASGPTNSMRGAAYLSGLTDCAVVDIGGTTSDAGILHGGFPREAQAAVDLGGVRTNFRMPDVVSTALGGGSVVRRDGERITIGPDSVGFRLREQALVFGGDTLTATDIAVAAGVARDIGDASRVTHLEPEFVRAAAALIDQMVADTVDRMKTTRDTMTVVVVGGGSVLVGDRLRGLDVRKPERSGVANAIGAAIAQVGGEVDRVFSMQSRSRDEVFTEAKAEAIAKAVAAGADADTTTVVDIEDVPLAHLPGGTAVRVRCKAVGNLAQGGRR